MTENAVRRLRRERGMTQDGLAEKSGVSQTLISLLERDRSALSPHVARKLAEALGVDPAELQEDHDAQA